MTRWSGSRFTKRLTLLQKIMYGFGDTGFSLTATIIGAYFAIFLTDVVHIPPATAALAIFGRRTWDYFNDPFIGHLTDRTRTRRARAKGYTRVDLPLTSADNPRTPVLAERFCGEIYKRDRVYRKPL